MHEEETEKHQQAKAHALSNVPRHGFFQGSIGNGFARMVSAALLRPAGWVETGIDIALMLPWSFGLIVPPPFATKHFIEGALGANGLFMKGDRGCWTAFPGGNSSKFKAEGYGNRTILQAVLDIPKNIMGKPTKFDIAKYEESQARDS